MYCRWSGCIRTVCTFPHVFLFDIWAIQMVVVRRQVGLIPTFRRHVTTVLMMTDSFNFGWMSVFQHQPEPNSVTVNMEVVRSFETSEQPKYTTRCKNPKDHHHLKKSGRENILKSYILGVVLIPEWGKFGEWGCFQNELVSLYCHFRNWYFRLGLQRKWHSIILLRLPVLKISNTKTSTLEHNLIWREERGMRVLWRIFAPKRGEVTGEGGYLYSEELHILCALPCIIRMLKYEDEWVM